MYNTNGNEPTTDEFGHRVPSTQEMDEATGLNDGPKNHVRLTDDDGEVHDLPLVKECCGDHDVTFEETEIGVMERCSTCGDYV